MARVNGKIAQKFLKFGLKFKKKGLVMVISKKLFRTALSELLFFPY